MELLYDKDHLVRSTAAEALGTLDQGSPEVVQALIECLQDDHYFVRFYSASAIGNLGQVKPEVVQALIGCLCDSNNLVRLFAASAIGKLGQNRQGDIVSKLVNWIEQNQQSDYVGHGIDALWDTVAERA